MGEVELFCRLIVENRGKVGIILQSMAPADVDRVLTLPWVSVISDALYGGGDMPHPRLYGAFPKFLREYVREKKLLTLGEAVRKMTSLPAKRLGLKDRGALLPGYYARRAPVRPGKVHRPGHLPKPQGAGRRALPGVCQRKRPAPQGRETSQKKLKFHTRKERLP